MFPRDSGEGTLKFTPVRPCVRHGDISTRDQPFWLKVGTLAQVGASIPGIEIVEPFFLFMPSFFFYQQNCFFRYTFEGSEVVHWSRAIAENGPKNSLLLYYVRT